MAEVTKPFTMAIAWNNAEEGWEFPVLPEKVTIKRNGAGKDYKIIGTGSVGTIEKPDLAEISFESFFPSQRSPLVNPKFLENPDWIPDPNKFVNDINKWMHSGYPVRFIYVGMNNLNKDYKIYLPMTIASFERWEEGGSPGDIFYSLKLKEYVFYAPQRIRAVKAADGTTKLIKEPPPRLDMRVPAKTYTLKPGDTLIRVARMQLGNSGRWREIMELNKITDSQLNKLPVGMVLQLPDRR
jgi:nucleoid-associated protein YgaU